MDDAEVVSVRLVRCPKCHKLLPEPSNCSIYQCGSCDAVLRVKKKSPSVNVGNPEDGSKESEKQYVKDERVDRVSDIGGANDVLDSNTLKKDLAQKKHDSGRSSSSRKGLEENGGAESEVKSNGRYPESWADEETRVENILMYRQPSAAKTDWTESVNSNSQRELLETPARINNKTESTGLMNDAAQLDFVREWISRNYGDPAGHRRVSSHAREEESLLFSPYQRNTPFRKYASMDGSSRGSPMDADHAELLRKLEHLKMEISRIYDVPEKTGNMHFPEDRQMYNSLPRPFAQRSPSEQHLYSRNHFGQFPYSPGNGLNMQDIYSHPGYPPSYPREYRDLVKPPSQRPPHQFAPKSDMESPIREGMEFREDLFAIHAHDPFPHHPMCSCLSCSQKYHPQFHSPARQTTFGIGGTPKSLSNFGLHHRTDSVPMWPPHGAASLASIPARSHHSRLPGSWPNDFHSDMDNLRSRKNPLPVHQGFKKYCHPLAGGAPFTTCPKCCELLKLPQVFKVKKLSVNLQCGSCFNMFLVDLGNRKRDTFLTRKFPVADEAMNERNEEPNEHSIADGTTCGESIANEAFFANADVNNLKFQREKPQHGEQSESRELSARMSLRSGSFTSVSSEDPMLSNFVLRGRIVRDVYKNENPTEYKELNVHGDLSRKSLSAYSVSTQEQHMPSDASGRNLEDESLQNDHKENKELNSGGRMFTSVSSEDPMLSNFVLRGRILQHVYKNGILTEHKELNAHGDLSDKSLRASSVSSQEQHMPNDAWGKKLEDESLQNDHRENKELNSDGKMLTSATSEDPMLSNFVLRGRILQDVFKNENPSEHKELNAHGDLSGKSFLRTSSVSSQEQHMPNDAPVRNLDEKSLQNDHKETKELNSDGKRFAVHSVSSEERNLPNEMIVAGISEEEASRVKQTEKELNDRIYRNGRRVSLEKQDLSNRMNLRRILHEESQQKDLRDNQDSSESMGQNCKSFMESFNFSEEPKASRNVITALEVTNAVEKPLADAFSPSPQGVGMVNQLPESFSEIGPGQSATEIDTQSSLKENSINEIVAEPEIEFSFTSCPSSNEHMDARRSSDKNSQMNFGKWSESASLLSIIRKSFNDFSRYQQNEDDEMTNVTINGHPITKDDLKRAEILAGRVLPGHYWYDYYGGFWGVMGEPCLGIVSPFIEEFNFPLRANCAAGNTGVLVNGRELHQLDLELLATRGLPTERNRSYKIDICGTVYDERTGEELKSLGMLAPSVIKAKRGFGMGVPAKYESSVNALS